MSDHILKKGGEKQIFQKLNKNIVNRIFKTISKKHNHFKETAQNQNEIHYHNTVSSKFNSQPMS